MFDKLFASALMCKEIIGYLSIYYISLNICCFIINALLHVGQTFFVPMFLFRPFLFASSFFVGISGIWYLLLLDSMNSFFNRHSYCHSLSFTAHTHTHTIAYRHLFTHWLSLWLFRHPVALNPFSPRIPPIQRFGQSSLHFLRRICCLTSRRTNAQADNLYCCCCRRWYSYCFCCIYCCCCAPLWLFSFLVCVCMSECFFFRVWR